MRQRLSAGFAGILYFSGIVALARWWTRRAGRRLIILTYHRVTTRSLHCHMQYVRRHYRPLPLEEALEYLYASTHQHQLDARLPTPIAITFDDGYFETYEHTKLLSHALHIPFTVMLVPGYIDSGDRFWWYEGAALAAETTAHGVTLGGRRYQLDVCRDRQALSRAITEYVASSSSVAERESFIARAREALAVPVPEVDYDAPMRPLTWDEVYTMANKHQVSFGAHTIHHPVLGFLSDPSEACDETIGCREILEKRLGNRMRVFAYPLGKMEHIGDSGVSAVRKAGYAWAVTTIWGVNTPDTDPLLLHRIGVGSHQHWLVLAADMAGVWPPTYWRILSAKLRHLFQVGSPRFHGGKKAPGNGLQMHEGHRRAIAQRGL